MAKEFDLSRWPFLKQGTNVDRGTFALGVLVGVLQDGYGFPEKEKKWRGESFYKLPIYKENSKEGIARKEFFLQIFAKANDYIADLGIDDERVSDIAAAVAHHMLLMPQDWGSAEQYNFTFVSGVSLHADVKFVGQEPIERAYHIPDVARELGKSRQAIQGRFDRGTMPTPDGYTQDRPYWYRKTLLDAGIVDPEVINSD